MTTGARALLEAAVEAGVEVCFANPGTTELPIVAALDEVAGIRPVLALAEGVVTGAADGYGRMRERPALTLMHLGPGLANGLANLHNAFRARSPIVNLVGDHPTWHRPFDPPLATDIAALAAPVSQWLGVARPTDDVRQTMFDAITAAELGQVATLIVPEDVQWAQCASSAQWAAPTRAPSIDQRAVIAAATLLRSGAVLLVGGHGLRERGMRAVARIFAATGCRVMGETFPARIDYGQGLPVVERFPYLAEMAAASLARSTAIVLAGALSPVAYFARDGMASRVIPDALQQHVLVAPTGDVIAALEALADELGAGDHVMPRPALPAPTNELTPRNVVSVLATVQPEGAIIVDEGVSAGGLHFGLSAACPPFSCLTLTGGATGFGMPCAVGAAIACPDRPVIVIEGDGSAMYSLPALWTMARQSLHVITVVLANQRYRILDLELERQFGKPSKRLQTLTDFSEPRIRWSELAASVGVPARQVATIAELRDALVAALAAREPFLIEAIV